MSVQLQFYTQNASIDSVELDASLTENHSTRVTITKHPIETGAKITDHMLLEPASVTIEGLVSNTPLPKAGDPDVPQTFTRSDGQELRFQSKSTFVPYRASTAYEQLLDIAASGDLVSVVTSIRTYDNMKLTSLDVPRDAASGQALKFTATLEEIVVVTNKTAQVKSSTTKKQPKKDLGPQTTTDAPPKTENFADSVFKPLTFIGGGG